MTKNNGTLGTIESVTTKTLVSYGSSEFPRSTGNCFSVKCSGIDSNIKIVNFNYENLEYLINIGMINFPMTCYFIGEYTAVMYDSRIPLKWYQNHFCTTCCPENLLPMPQRLNIMLMKSVGDIKDNGNARARKLGPESHYHKVNEKLKRRIEINNNLSYLD